MYLRDLVLCASQLAVFPRGKTARDFNLSAIAPVEAYLDALPRRKVQLDDLAKVNIVVGPKRAAERPYFAALNVAIIYWQRFSFRQYFALSRTDQQEQIIKIVHQSLLRIARRTHAATDWYQAALLALKQRPFPLPELSEHEVRRRWGLLPRKRKR